VYTEKQLITYLGNKRKLLNFIEEGIKDTKISIPTSSFYDVFSGSGVVSRFAKDLGFNKVTSNDFEYYSYLVNKAYLTNIEDINISYVKEFIEYLNENKLTEDYEKGIIETLYAPEFTEDIQLGERVFYTNENAKIIDNIRRMIDDDNDYKDYLFIAYLIVKASIHTNTSGVFKGFHKGADGAGRFGGRAGSALTRIMGEIILENPVFSINSCEVEVLNKDAKDLSISADIVYLDPPYNQHPYGSNYHMLNTIAKYKDPGNISKVAGIPTDWQRSDYNKATAYSAFKSLIENIEAKYILISYNNEGIISSNNLMNICKEKGKTTLKIQEYNTYKGSRNLSDRSAKVNEFLYIIET
jgi:adenine-specific DNA-methyltransferase